MAEYSHLWSRSGVYDLGLCTLSTGLFTGVYKACESSEQTPHIGA